MPKIRIRGREAAFLCSYGAEGWESDHQTLHRLVDGDERLGPYGSRVTGKRSASGVRFYVQYPPEEAGEMREVLALMRRWE